MKLIKDAALVFLCVVCVPLGMTAFDQYREREALERELNARKAVACPQELQGRELLGNLIEAHNIFHPKAVVLSCLYAKGVEG